MSRPPSPPDSVGDRKDYRHDLEGVEPWEGSSVPAYTTAAMPMTPDPTMPELSRVSSAPAAGMSHYERQKTPGIETTVDTNPPQERGVMSKADQSVGKIGRCSGQIPKLDDFELIRTIGKGCAGRVLLVRHAPDRSIHAMKAISKRRVLAADELEHTMTELRILRYFAKRDENNLHVAHLNYAFTDRENFYFVMDFYPGGDLATQFELRPVLGSHRTRFYAVDIVLGLEDLHRHGVIVRDLKPENILLDRRGHAVLADFGLSKQFPYRGQPRPVQVVRYPNQSDMPEWAGMGIGSLRSGVDGEKHILLDTAHSFVGTAEYISPDVLKGLGYTYAVDWWALGCILLECLVGRVPFRQEKNETLMQFWNKILSDPWDDFFEDPIWARHSLDRLGIDTATYSLLNGLLQKDPMWRLTEPYVRAQDYFSDIDWDVVRLGGYNDPHDLQLNDADEYDTRYFPKLCLQEEPSIDMSTYGQQESDDWQPSALNDDALYALQQLRFREQLEDFAWSPAELDHDVSDSEPISRPSARRLADTFDDPIQLGRVVGDYVDSVIAKSRHVAGVEGEDEVAQLAAGLIGAKVTATGSLTPPTQGSMRRGSVSTANSPPGPRLLPVSPKSTVSKPSFQLDTGSPVSSAVTTPAQSGMHAVADDTSTYAAESLVRAQADASSPPTTIGGLPGHTMEPGAIPREGLPQGGLSVSDMISVPTSETHGRHRVIRRHPQEPLDEAISAQRLSVDVNGEIRPLEDEEWEKLDADEHGPSAPNGKGGTAPSTFFTRNFGQVLRRKPSTVQTSGLRHVTRGSDSSLESSALSSPVKSSTKSHPGSLFGHKSRGISKRALGKIKVFPKLRKVSESDKSLPPVSPRKRDGRPGMPPFVIPSVDTMPGFSAPDEPPAPIEPDTLSPSRPGVHRAQTEGQGWERRPKLQKKMSIYEDGAAKGDSESRFGVPWRRKMKRNASTPPSPNARAEAGRIGPTSAKSQSLESFASARTGGVGTDRAPRLELSQTPPVDWELEAPR